APPDHRPARPVRCRRHRLRLEPGRRHPADRTRPAGTQRGPARTRPVHGPGPGPLRRTGQPAGTARRAERGLAGDQPLELPGLHRVLRGRQGHRRGPGQGQPQRDRTQAHAMTHCNRDDARLPAEWEPQAAILLAWPHAGTDWAERLEDVEETYIALVAAITRFQRVLLCVADDDIEAYARARLSSARVDMDRVTFATVPYDDTWLRDSGPITLLSPGGACLLDFRFTAWGGKFEAAQDDRLVERLHRMGFFSNSERQPIDFALEGGAIDIDGQGTLLSTWQCLHERHPDATREDISAKLAGWLRQERVLWL